MTLKYETYDTASIYLDEGWYKITELKKLLEQLETTNEQVNKHMQGMLGKE